MFGQTRYTDTAYAEFGGEFNVITSCRYCVGCNGTFGLFIDQNSFGTPTGVFGAGVD